MGEMETEKRLHLLDNEIMYEPQYIFDICDWIVTCYFQVLIQLKAHDWSVL